MTDSADVPGQTHLGAGYAGARPPANPRLGDAFGALLTAAHDGTTSYGVIERDDGLVNAHDARVYFTAPADWAELDRAGCAGAVGRALVIGCGAGRHALHLQEAGLPVTGLDRSPGACAVAQHRGVRDVRTGSVHDMGAASDRFDTVLALGNDLALLGSPDLAVARLTALAQVTVSGGRLLGTNSHPTLEGAPPDHADYHARTIELGKPPGQIRIRTRFQRLADPWLDYWFFAPTELDPILAHTPWRCVRVDHDGPGYLLELVNRG